MIAHSCLLLVVNVDLGMSFHDLSDASSKVLQRVDEVFDNIQMSNTVLNHCYLLFYQVIDMLDQIVIVCHNITCHFSISIIEFISTQSHQRVHGK